MATLTGNRLTLIELAKRTKDGSVMAIAEVLNKTNAILDDAVYVQANDQTSHTTSKRTYLPTGSWRKINQGVVREASHTTQIVEQIGMLEAFSQVDEALVDMSPNPVSFRLSEDLSFIEGMSQTLSTALFYSTTVSYPEKFNGFATRYASLTTTASTTHNVRGCGGTGSALSSLWIIQWGPDKVHMVYPRFSRSVGITQKDDGLLTVYDANNNPYKVYQTQFKVMVGLCVRDDRCVQRICNINTAATPTQTGYFDEDKVMEAIRELPDSGRGAVLYANKYVMSQIDIKAKDKVNVFYNPADPFGRPQTYFMGIPLKQVDALTVAETALT